MRSFVPPFPLYPKLTSMPRDRQYICLTLLSNARGVLFFNFGFGGTGGNKQIQKCFLAFAETFVFLFEFFVHLQYSLDRRLLAHCADRLTSTPTGF